ncbi:hypothetical protein LA303_07990 [Candidatus Sulfidibacterium hydrothermale]|nr:hypothetical protein [Candidatus Sulfidibacterium hydrothermale]UBM61328.1 hypothetical protein LA303_07810 [Candidatus Sulfidibacterium hydrothermale]UBM61364.1 hypothetical protein LA303_07990 [Candidatus Sulfidibacterium hydrothermale]
MKTLFTKTYRKKVQNKRKEDIIDLFLTNISGTHYRKVERESDKLIIKGSFPELFQNSIMTLWAGFCRKAELYFSINNDIVYSVDYTYGVISLFTALMASILPMLFFSLNIATYGFVPLSVLVLGIFHIIIRLYLHRQVFVKTLNFKNLYKGKYDWNKILKSKTDNELKNIVNGNTTLTIEVQKMAEEELIRRKEK